jgi:WD40 repeat protein
MSCPNHRYGVTDLDYNPNKPHMLVTSGRDSLIKFWDLRKTSLSTSYNSSAVEAVDTTTGPSSSSEKYDVKMQKQHPLLVARGGHRHWATRVLYNPFHDQLVLSAGSDSIVNLWRMSTISSAPLVMLEEDEFGTDLVGGGGGAANGESKATPSITEGPNVRVSRYEHMDSVHAIAWSAADAWTYLSASYDGKVVLNHVPSQEKYKILL